MLLELLELGVSVRLKVRAALDLLHEVRHLELARLIRRLAWRHADQAAQVRDELLAVDAPALPYLEDACDLVLHLVVPEISICIVHCLAPIRV